MSIWFKDYSLDAINQRSKNTMAEFLDIKFTKINDDSLVAQMPVTDKVKQPAGIVHGGANVVLAETIASTAANICVDLEKFYCVGLEINANHIKSVTKGIVEGIARPLHIGRSTHVWEIKIYNSAKELTCVSRMTAQVITRK